LAFAQKLSGDCRRFESKFKKSIYKLVEPKFIDQLGEKNMPTLRFDYLLYFLF
jgi:hypothetical protein